MIAQFQALKQAHPDALLFFRMGEFYELFFEDAVAAAPALDIALTKRGRHAGEDIPMCGVPVHSAELYLHRLIRKGFKVAICEQLEDPAEARKRPGKPLVRRDVVRIVTAGTLTEDGLLDPRRSNWLAAVAAERGRARPRPGRHLDRRLRHRARRPRRAARGAGPLAAGEILLPARLLGELDGALPRERRRGDAAPGRELRQHRRRAPPVPGIRRRHAGRARALSAGPSSRRRARSWAIWS